MKKYKIYFAGKINAEWRNIFTQEANLSKINSDGETYYIDQYTGYTSAQPFEICIDKISFIYNGPFRYDCGHGCPEKTNHMSQSICDMNSKTSNKQILETCCEQIDHSDFMIANLDCLDCYGTIAEIGYMYCRMPVYVVCNNKDIKKHLWFAISMADKVFDTFDIDKIIKYHQKHTVEY